MMMKMNVQLLCEDLDQLLKDICDYLSNQVNDEELTEKERLFANKLIQRSKKQLQQISKVSMALSTDVDDSSYVDMNKQSAVKVEEAIYDEEEMNEYTPIDCADIQISEEQTVCPYESLPAIQLEKCEKFGDLDKKERFLFIGHQKRLFAGVKGHWLLLYGTKKDLKPLEKLNLLFFAAKPTQGVRTKSFELTCTKTQKIYQFVAQTPKDMVQWVTCINKSCCKTTKESINGNHVADEDEDENVYEPLKITTEPIDNKHKSIKKSKPLPPLPPQNPQNTYILRSPKAELPPADVEESYDAICAPNSVKVEQGHQDETEEEIYDIIQDHDSGKPKETKPIIKSPLPNVPTPMRHPKLIETVTVDSSLTDSFTEDEDEQIYDKLEPPPVQQLSRRRPPDPEPEEEYCNLVTREPATNESQLHSDPDEVYSNLVPMQHHKQKPAEPQEEYSNILEIAANVDKRILPIPPLKPKVTVQAKLESQADDEEELSEYHCVVQVPKAVSPKGSLHSKGKLLFLHQISSQSDKIKSKERPPPPPVRRN